MLSDKCCLEKMIVIVFKNSAEAIFLCSDYKQ